MSLHFKGPHKKHFKQIAEEVYSSYSELHPYDIYIERGTIKSSTMYARPVFRLKALWEGFDHYRLKVAFHVRDSQNLKVNHLDLNVLKGWIAHEMGHLVDYLDRSVLEMAIYGVRYIWSKKFAKEVEHKADKIAVYHGFYEAIKATKRFLFFHEEIHPSYSEKLKSTYMSLDALEICNTDYERSILNNS